MIIKPISSRIDFHILAVLVLATISACTMSGADFDEKNGGKSGLNQNMGTCIEGMAAGTYPCSNIDLVAHLSPQELLGDRLNDIWGWTDPETGKEYALVGMSDRVTFVDISIPDRPVVVGTLPESASGAKTYSGGHYILHDDDDSGTKSTWRDLKVYKNHVFVVSDGQPHGLQVFDLTRLRDAEDPGQLFEEDVHYTGFANAHNIAINETSGYAYVVGSNMAGGGLFILDVSDPLNPEAVGIHADYLVGYEQTGYVHDTQCVNYEGPDSDYVGSEICFNASETHLVVANVTDKQSAYTIARRDYTGRIYAHQGWLTEDQRYFLLDDELDERNLSHPTRTYIWDVQDLDDPLLIGTYTAENASIDHNQYIRGSYSYQANYTSGLRILDLSDIAEGTLSEAAFFDTVPEDDRQVFEGAWSNYPFFESGIVVVSDVFGGLFILSPNLD